jgi:hypothetical protein
MVWTWLAAKRKRARSSNHSTQRYRPRLQTLEDRTLPAPLLVTGADAGGGPQVNVYDAFGNLSFSFFAYDPRFRGGVRVAVADVTGDGIPDVITAPGPGGGPDVRVFDGARLNTANFHSDIVREFMAYSPLFPGGVFVAGGDVNRDGFADIITGADAGGGPHVKIFSGFDLHVFGSFYAYERTFTGGVRVASGDVNRDGFADVITGSGPGRPPEVHIYDGSNGLLASSFLAYSPGFLGGVYVASGDVNRDGFFDVITGAGAGGGPVVNIYNGFDGLLLSSFNAFEPTFSGGVRVGSGNVSLNGFWDVFTSRGPGGIPQVLVYDGFTGAVVGNFLAYAAAFRGGVFVGGGG